MLKKQLKLIGTRETSCSYEGTCKSVFSLERVKMLFHHYQEKHEDRVNKLNLISRFRIFHDAVKNNLQFIVRTRQTYYLLSAKLLITHTTCNF